MQHALRVRFALAVLVACLLGGTRAAAQNAGPPSPNPIGETVAIIPFSNITGESSDGWIGAGIAETLTADLQDGTAFDVVSREFVSEVMSAMGSADETPADDVTMLELGRRLGTRWLVSGGYQRLGDRIRITGQLIDVRTATIVRTAKIDGAIDDLFALQDRIAAQLVDGDTAPDRDGSVPSAQPVRLAAPAPPSATGASRPAGASRVAGSSEPGEVSTSPSAVNAGFGVPNMIDGPLPPLPPEVISRDAAGRATVRAIRLSEPLDLDGTLDERVYQDVPALSDFVQVEPVPGAPASERTQAWVFFDDDNIYISGLCWDSAPESQWVANEMRRDNLNVVQNENIAFLLDTFYDRRNGIVINLNPIGGRTDGQVTDERSYSGDWNPIWDFQTGRFEQGWTFETAIPFKSLRYRPGQAQIWGLNIRRQVRWKNEVSYLVPMPPARGAGAIFQASMAATLVGLEVPAGSRNLEIKPYAISELTSDRNAAPQVSNDLAGDVGFDVKYGVTQSLVGDFTVNTDFAQVEADEQQVNLTRFSLFFPEKREFFLENQGLFAFGGARTFSPRGGGGDTPVLFYPKTMMSDLSPT